MTTEKHMDSDKDPDIHRRASSQAGKPTGAVYGDQHRSVDGACSPAQLHVCFHCAGELVYPLDWSEEGPRHWRIVLRCPECESRREGVFDQTAVERLDDELDRGSSALLGDLRRMTHANMSEEVEFFVRALDAELIMPSDF
ncbi:MAG TPA: hypothetical protein VK680_15640 [Solirubrobacteraceae bacterium]|jgi:hypothetical protein|nr:hypothetical protein [Solirubrobacteraceae bacterium]